VGIKSINKNHIEVKYHRPLFVRKTSLNIFLFVNHSLQSLLNDLVVIKEVFSLPVLEPLTPERLSKVISITLASLYAATSAAIATTIVDLSEANKEGNQGRNDLDTKVKFAPGKSQEDDIDHFAIMVMQRAVSRFG
jgi:E3 ubiquitin-protein ligase UBR4